ncbi:hypothetical protein DTL21_07040 [Bremerella cremea]|uniref:Uncharacterized protein n=1 Tax=Blastopirellula marina TaxID=124 RepID=A0A2S8G0M6_9BACT|nr:MULTISPECIES: hypothetical protein [Pirellulaceae]PQO37694.1 hypothetical protein C5Y83_07040 [Blastopirellula marina]RCS50081.1 hypothetical protein DTL21_07040 [Bremerella cremea]
MIFGRSLGVALLAVGVCGSSSGCFSLSLGTRNCSGDSPEAKARMNALEKRVSALEQMIGPAPSPSDGIPTGPTPITMEPLPHGMP